MQIVNDKYVLDDLEVLSKDIGYGLDSNRKSLIFEFILVFSKSFQRFAVRTSKQMDEISNLAAKKKEQLAEQMKDISKNFDSFKDR